MIIINFLALLIAQPTDIIQQQSEHNIDANIKGDDIKEAIKLSPPLNHIITLKKQQNFKLNGMPVTRHSAKQIIFTPTAHKNIIGYDISIKLIDIKTESNDSIGAIFSNIEQEVGNISHFSYDVGNDKLILHNSEKAWQSVIKAAKQISNNAGQRTTEQQSADKILLNRLENTPEKTRNAFLSEDLAIILSFVGKEPSKDWKTNDSESIIYQTHQRSNGSVVEENNYQLSSNSGLVTRFHRRVYSQNNEAQSIDTIIKLIIKQ